MVVENSSPHAPLYRPPVVARRGGRLWHTRSTYLPIGVARGLCVALLAVIVVLRVTHATYRTLFVDEAIYATIGQDLLVGVFKQNATTFIFGSYLYPALAGLASNLGGVAGLRVLSAMLSSVSAVFVYLATARLVGRHAALWAMAIFGLAGVSISLGQLAVIDSLAVPLLAVALYCLVAVAMSDARGPREDRYLWGAAVSFSLACLAKYITILYLPALVLVVVALYVVRGRPLPPLLKFPWVTALILGLYGFVYRDDLAQVFRGTNSYQFATRWSIVRSVSDELGAVLLLAVVGAALLSQLPLATPRRPTPWNRIIPALGVPVLLACIMSTALYSIGVHNGRSLEKHVVYSLVFLAPLAGYACATLIEQIRRCGGAWSAYVRATGAVVTVAGLIWFSDYSLGRNWGFQHSWPSTAPVIAYLKTHGVSTEDRVLASGSYIYDYYLNFGVAHRDMWHSTWYLAYKGQSGLPAMKAAIHNHWFTAVILDDYYTTTVAQQLAVPLRRAGYVVGYHTTERLSFGAPIWTRVYVLPVRRHGGARR